MKLRDCTDEKNLIFLHVCQQSCNQSKYWLLNFKQFEYLLVMRTAFYLLFLLEIQATGTILVGMASANFVLEKFLQPCCMDSTFTYFKITFFSALSTRKRKCWQQNFLLKFHRQISSTWNVLRMKDQQNLKHFQIMHSSLDKD